MKVAHCSVQLSSLILAYRVLLLESWSYIAVYCKLVGSKLKLYPRTVSLCESSGICRSPSRL
jgi:hypothetical protein